MSYAIPVSLALGFISFIFIYLSVSLKEKPMQILFFGLGIFTTQALFFTIERIAYINQMTSIKNILNPLMLSIVSVTLLIILYVFVLFIKEILENFIEVGKSA